jgi:hypothetical protein
MAYQFHDTAHIEKRAGERGFSVEQAMLTINEPVSIIKTPVRRGNHGFIWLFSRAFASKEFWKQSQRLKANARWIITGDVESRSPGRSTLG